MSKRDRDLKQRLDELFSSTPEPEPIEAAPVRSDAAGTIAAVAEAASPIDAGLFKTILDHVPLPIYIKDRDHKWIGANPAFCQLIGQPAGTLLGHVDKQQSDEAWRLDDQVLESGQSEDMQESTTTPDGLIQTRRVRRIPLSNAKDEIQYVLGIIEETIRPPAAEASSATVPLTHDRTELQTELVEQRQNAARFRAIVEATPIPILITRVTDGKPLYVNSRASEMFGVPLDQMLYHTTPEFYHDPADRQKILAALQRDGGVSNYRVQLKKADGSPIWAMLSVQPMTFNGEAAVLSGFYDISDQERTEEELAVRATEAAEAGTFLDLVLEHLPTGLFVKDAKELRFVRWNKANAELIGLSPDEVIGKNDHDFFPKEEADFFAAKDREVLANSQLVDIPEEPVDTRHKGRRLLHTRKVPIFGSDGQPKYLLGISEDITERKQAEADVQRSAQLLRTMIDNLPDLIYIKNAKSEFIVANQPLAHLVGAASPEDLEGKTDFDFFPRELAAKYYTDEQAIIQSGQPLIASEETTIDQAGKQRWQLTTKVPFRNQQGEIEGIVGLGRDITDRRQAEVERERLLKSEAKRALQLQTAAEVAKATASILSLDDLLPLVVELIRERFDLYYVGLFLIDDSGKWAVLRAGTGEAGRKMLEGFHRLETGGSSMIGRCVATGQGHIALDVGEEAVRFDNPLLPKTRSEMALPLISRGQPIGALTIQSAQLSAFAQDDVTALQAMADQVANAIANAQLFEQVRAARTQAESRLRELAFLQQVGQAVSSTLDLTRVLDALFDTLEHDMGFSHIALALLDPAADEVRVPRASGLAAAMQGLRRPLSQMQNDILVDVARKGQIEVIDGWDDRFDREIYEREGHANLVRAFVPLRLRDEGIGVLEVGYQRQVRASITPEEVRLLGGLADQVAIAVGNVRLFEQARVRADQLAALNRIGQSLAKLAERSEIVELVYQVIGQVIDNRNLYIALYDAAKNYIEFPIYTINGERRAIAGRPFGNGMTEYAIRTKTPLLIQSDVQDYSDRLGIARVGLPAQCFLAVPMLAGDKVIGVVTLQDYEHTHVFSNEHVELLTTITSQAAVALENARLFEQARFRAEELAALNALSQTLTAQLDVNQVLEEVLRGTSRLLDTANFYIALYDPAKHEVSFPINFTQSVIDKQITTMSADRGLTGYIIRTRKSLLIKENVADWQDKMGVPRVGESAQSWLGVPLMIGDQMLGVMAIQSYTGERLYDEHDQELLTAIASQAAIAIQNARLFEQTQQQANEATAFNEIIQAISLHVDLTHVLETTYQHIHKLVPVDAFIVALRDEQTDTVRYPLIYDEGQRYEPSVGPLNPETPTGQVIMTGQPLLINRTPEELAQAAQTIPVAALGNVGKPSASLMYLPLKLGQAVIGVLSVQSYQLKAYTPEHLALMTRLVGQLAVAIQNARLFEQTQEALTEMDSLYRASAEINIAQSYGDILSALCKHTHLADGAHNIALNHFDHIWTPQQMPHDIHVLTQLGNPLPVLQTAVARYPLVAGIERVLQADALTVVEDVATDPRISDKLRTFYQNTLGASSIIFLPLVVSGKWIGYIHALYQQPKPLSEAELRRLTLLTSQAAVAVQNLRSVEETQAALTETERLYTASRQLASAKDLPEIVSAVAGMQTPDINRAVVWLFDRNDRDEVTSAIVSAGWHSGSGVPPMPIGTRLPLAMLQAMRLVLTTEPVFSNDVQRDARIDRNTAALLLQQNIGAIAILPLWAGTRQIGAFLLESETPHEFIESEIRPYISLTQQMSIAVDNRLLFERTQRDTQRERTIAAISERIYSTTDVKDLLRITAEELRRATGSARAVVKLGRVGSQSNGSTIHPVVDDEGVTQ